MFPKSLVRRARRLVELRYPNPAADVGAEAAHWAGIKRADLARAKYAAARESLRELSRAPGELLFEAIERIEREVDAELCTLGYEALKTAMGEVAPWSVERIARYAEALERHCETRDAAWFEDAAYGRGE